MASLHRLSKLSLRPFCRTSLNSASSELSVVPPTYSSVYNVHHRSMSTIKIPAEGLEIFRCAYTPYYHRALWVGLVGIGASSVFLLYKALLEKPEDKSPHGVSLPTATLIASLFIPASFMMSRSLRKIVHSIKLLPTNELHITSMGWPSPGAPVIVPVNKVVPPLTDIRTTVFGRALKVVKDAEKFGNMKVETIFSVHPTGNVIKGKARDAFEHICIDNTSFRLK